MVIDSGQAMSNGYVLSKLAAERFVHRAFRHGLQGAVFRPGMLWGNSTTGWETAVHISYQYLMSFMREHWDRFFALGLIKCVCLCVCVCVALDPGPTASNCFA